MPGLGPEALGALVHQDFAAAMRAAGHTFRILTTSTTSTAGTPRRGDTLPTSSLWRAADAAAAPWLRTRQVLSPAAALARHLRENPGTVDLLHVEVAYPHGAAATLAADASGWRGPRVITPMGEDTLVHEPSHYGFRRHALPRRLVERALRRATGIRCISPLHERTIAAIAPDTPRRTIPLNVSSAVIDAAHEPAAQRDARRREARAALDQRWNTQGRTVIISLGRLHPFKGVDVLIRALRMVPDAVLLIAGPSLVLKASGDEATRLSKLIDQLNLGDRAKLTGPVPPLAATQLMAAADVLVVPSHIESLNKVCVEATAVGTRFVVTETTGIAAWAASAPVGVVVPPTDELLLANGIVRALSMPPPDADAIRAFVDPFSPARVAAAVSAFYRDLTAELR
ncbi:MAG: glycosyltransferase [Vicinamibacterales bacterium]